MSLLGLAALGFGAQFQLELMSKRDSVRVPLRDRRLVAVFPVACLW